MQSEVQSEHVVEKHVTDSTEKGNVKREGSHYLRLVGGKKQLY